MRIHALLLAVAIQALALPAGDDVPVPDKPMKGDKKAEAPAKAEGEWQKVVAKPLALATPRQIMSPGLFDRSLQRVITFPKDAFVDLGLPHAGKDSNGKEHPALLAKALQDYIWVDVNGDGRPGADETRLVKPEGHTDPFNIVLHYDGGINETYSFYFQTVLKSEKFILIRNMARQCEFQGQKIVLLDEDGNGKYNDLDRDAMLVGDGPLSFLSKYVQVGDDFFEVLVQPAGDALEIRPADKLELGRVDVFEAYVRPQESENLRIYTIIISGPQGSYAFDERRRSGKVPTGAYDLRFALFERAKEIVCLNKGEKTSFTVAAKGTAAPKWGGKIKAEFELESDGQLITALPPRFLGEGTETYFAENNKTLLTYAHIARIFEDSTRIEHTEPFNSRKTFKQNPDGTLKPVEFTRLRDANDLYEVAVEYNSGILGKILSKDRIQFVFKRKKPEKK